QAGGGRRAGEQVPQGAAPATVGRAGRERGHRPWLADARLADDRHHLTLATNGGRQTAPQEIELVVATDEVRATSARGLPALEAVEPEGCAPARRRPEREEIEATGQEGGPRCADDDRAGLGALQQ